jgi:hypothetical protein
LTTTFDLFLFEERYYGDLLPGGSISASPASDSIPVHIAQSPPPHTRQKPRLTDVSLISDSYDGGVKELRHNQRRLTNISLLSVHRDIPEQDPIYQTSNPTLRKHRLSCMSLLSSSDDIQCQPSPSALARNTSERKQRRVTDISLLSAIPAKTPFHSTEVSIDDDRQLSLGSEENWPFLLSDQESNYQPSVPEIEHAADILSSDLDDEEEHQSQSLEEIIPINTYRQEYSQSVLPPSNLTQIYGTGTETVFSNPVLWASAIEDIETLRPETFVSQSVINLYLLAEWYKCQETCLSYYIDMLNLSEVLPEEAEIHQFWSLHLLKEAGDTLEHKPVVFILRRNNHYFTVCFEFQRNTAWVFGKWWKAPQLVWTMRGQFCNWNDWGPRYWEKVARLFRFMVSSTPVKVVTCDFPQVNLCLQVSGNMN